MGNKDTNERADKFFFGIGGVLEKGANSAINTLSLPQQLMKSATDFISSTIGGILIPIVAIGGLYVASQIVKK